MPTPDPQVTTTERVLAAAKGVDPHYVIGVLALVLGTGGDPDIAIDVLGDAPASMRTAAA